MSYPLDSDVQEDVRTFPMYQRLRKINPYAYYSLQTQKQMQSDLRNFGSLTFFEQNIDDILDVPEPIHSIELPKALAEAEHMLDTGSPDFNEKTETILSVLYASDTVPIRRCALHGDKHKVFAALIVMMHEQSLQLEVNEYNTVFNEETNWSVFNHGRPITKKRFTQMLGDFGIKPTKRSKANVFYVADLEDVFKRYQPTLRKTFHILQIFHR